MLLYTSVPPRFSRKDQSGNEIGPEYLAACVESWRDNGFEPVSINRPDEVDSVKALGLLDVLPAKMTEAIWPNRYGPALADLFDALPANERIAYVNADIFMLRGNLAQVLSGIDDDKLVTARRCDVAGIGAESCEVFQLGLDLLSFNPARVTSITADVKIRRFQLGAPWWDYVFPLACLKSIGLCRLSEPAIVHQRHDDRWDPSIWKELGLRAGQAIVAYFPQGFVPILENVANNNYRERVLAMGFQARLFADLSSTSVAVVPCSYFPRTPTLIEQPSRIPKILPPNFQLAHSHAQDLPFILPSKSHSWPRRALHSVRDRLRSVRRRAGLP